MSQVANMRQNLRHACLELLLREPEFGRSKDVDKTLWNEATYVPLKVRRSASFHCLSLCVPPAKGVAQGAGETAEAEHEGRRRCATAVLRSALSVLNDSGYNMYPDDVSTGCVHLDVSTGCIHWAEPVEEVVFACRWCVSSRWLLSRLRLCPWTPQCSTSSAGRS